MYRLLRTVHDRYGNLIKNGSIVSPEAFTQGYITRLIKRGYVELLEREEPTTYKGDIKPCVVTGMWKRPEVFEIFGKHYQEIGIDVIVAGSEGKVSKKQAEKFGFIYLERPNQPLASKMNATIEEAMKRDYTHVICVGSDDLLSKELIDEYIELIKRGYDFIGILDLYFYDMVSGKASYWGGYRDKSRVRHSAGAGRVLSRKILKTWNNKVWDDSLSQYLDTAMQNRLAASTLPQYVFSIKDKGLFAVDIKSDVNMTPFELWDNTSYIDPSIITSKFNVRDSSSNKR